MDARRSLGALAFLGAFVGTGAAIAQVAYSYDALGRLVEAEHAGGSTMDYVYDAVGNRTSVVSAGGGGGGGGQTLTGTAGADVLTGGADEDTLYGLGGDDQLTGAGGSDLIHGGGELDTAIFDGAWANYTFVQQADGSVTATHNSSGDVDTIYTTEAVYFSGSTEWGYLFQAIAPPSTPQTITGTADGDMLTGGSGDDFISGNGGYDIIYGGDGADTIDGGSLWDTIALTGVAGDYTFVDQGGGVIHATHTSSSTVDVLTSIEQVYFVASQQLSDISTLLTVPSNTPPVAADNTYTPNHTVVPYELSVLVNDTDADQDVLKISSVQDSSGYASISQPDETKIIFASGQDCGIWTFSYTITDGNGGYDSANVTFDNRGGGCP